MTARACCFALLFCFAFSAHAEVTLYEFEGYFVSKHVGTDPAARFPENSFGAGEQFTGWVVYDSERRLPDGDDRRAAPLVSVYLETAFGQTVSSTNNNGRAGWGTGDGLAIVSYSVDASASDQFIFVGGAPFHGSIGFQWFSTETAQLPEEGDHSEGIPPAMLRPNRWQLSVNVSPQCSEASPCDPLASSSLKGHITRFGARPRIIHSEPFNTTPSGWTNTGGTWTTQNGYYRNTANVPFTHSVYTGAELSSVFDLHVTLSSQWRAAGNTLGLLLHYRDAANFDELRLNALGALTYARVTNGSRAVLLADQVAAEGPGNPFTVAVFQRGEDLILILSGKRIDMKVGTARGGRAGLFASWNEARFFDFRLEQFPQWLVTHSDFRQNASGWTPVAGTWSLVDGYFYSTSNIPAAIAVGAPFVQREYTVDTSMFLEWIKTGNRGGLVYDYKDVSNYRAVLVSAGTGPADGGRIDVVEVANGVRRVVLARGGPGASLAIRNPTIGVRRINDLTVITAQGATIALIQPPVTGARRAGLISQWNRVRFDDVVVGLIP